MNGHSAPLLLPPVTEAHRRAAFEAMRWAGWTFDAAMADDTRRRVVEARAHQVRTAEWQASRRTSHVARPTTSARRFRSVLKGTDLKRAAAGERAEPDDD